jgi:hypothetical protein
VTIRVGGVKLCIVPNIVSKLALICAVTAAGCALRPPPAFRDAPGSGPITNPFVPASMIVHPLTRLDTDAAGKRWLYCHLEFRDSWGDTVKAAGKLDLQLYRSSGARGMGRQELVWTVDLADLEQNSSLYDPATRTYRLPLEGPPAWLGEKSPEGPRGRLRAIFSTGGPREGMRTLEAEFPL